MEINIAGGKTIGGTKSNSIAAVKSDSVDTSFIVRGIHCNTGGTLIATLEEDTDGASQPYVMIAGIPYGGMRIKRIWSTGTTITGTILK